MWKFTRPGTPSQHPWKFIPCESCTAILHVASIWARKTCLTPLVALVFDASFRSRRVHICNFLHDGFFRKDISTRFKQWDGNSSWQLSPGATLSVCLPPQRLLRRRLGRSGGHGGAIGAECGWHGGTLRAMDGMALGRRNMAVSNDAHVKNLKHDKYKTSTYIDRVSGWLGAK